MERNNWGIKEEYYSSGALFPWRSKTGNEGSPSNEDTKKKNPNNYHFKHHHFISHK